MADIAAVVLRPFQGWTDFYFLPGAMCSLRFALAPGFHIPRLWRSRAIPRSGYLTDPQCRDAPNCRTWQNDSSSFAAKLMEHSELWRNPF